MLSKLRATTFLLILFLVYSSSKKSYCYNLYFKLFDDAVGIGHWESDKKFNFDENGVVLVDSSYNIVTISQYAIKCFGLFDDTKDTIYLNKFLNQYYYLNNIGIEVGDSALYFTYDKPFHDLLPGWTSGLAQAEVAMVFFRFNCLYPSSDNCHKIKMILNYMIDELCDVSYNSKAVNSFFIHEYKDSRVYNYVLNGHLIGLISLIECNQLFEDQPYCEYIDAGVRWLEEELQNYISINERILFYDLKSKAISHPWYMKAVVWEINCLSKLTYSNKLDFYGRLLSFMAYDLNFEFVDCRFNNLNFISSCFNECEHENSFMDDKKNFKLIFRLNDRILFAYNYELNRFIEY